MGDVLQALGGLGINGEADGDALLSRGFEIPSNNTAVEDDHTALLRPNDEYPLSTMPSVPLLSSVQALTLAAVGAVVKTSASTA